MQTIKKVKLDTIEALQRVYSIACRHRHEHSLYHYTFQFHSHTLTTDDHHHDFLPLLASGLRCHPASHHGPSRRVAVPNGPPLRHGHGFSQKCASRTAPTSDSAGCAPRSPSPTAPPASHCPAPGTSAPRSSRTCGAPSSAAHHLSKSPPATGPSGGHSRARDSSPPRYSHTYSRSAARRSQTHCASHRASAPKTDRPQSTASKCAESRNCRTGSGTSAAGCPWPPSRAAGAYRHIGHKTR